MNDDIAKEWFQTLLEPLNLELYMQENIASQFRDMDVVSRSRSLRSSRIKRLFFCLCMCFGCAFASEACFPALKCASSFLFLLSSDYVLSLSGSAQELEQTQTSFHSSEGGHFLSRLLQIGDLNSVPYLVNCQLVLNLTRLLSILCSSE